MWLLLDQLETVSLVNPPRSVESVVCPEPESLVSRATGESDALVDEAASKA
jgi:hypothetical protein